MVYEYCILDVSESANEFVKDHKLGFDPLKEMPGKDRFRQLLQTRSRANVSPMTAIPQSPFT